MEDKKVFSGGKPICMQINNSIDKLNRISRIIEESDKSPEIYLQEQLFEDYLESEFILKNVEYSYGIQAVNSFHIDFIQKVLKVLGLSIQFSEISLETLVDEDGYYYILVNIGFLEDEFPIIEIYPYFKKFKYIKCDRFDELLDLEKAQFEKITKCEEHLNFINDCYNKPELYTGDDIKLFIKMQNQKKKEAILNKELNDALEQLQQAKNDLYLIQDELNELNNTLTSIYITRDRYAERLENRFGFSILQEINFIDNIDNENELITEEELVETKNDFFNQSVSEPNENKEFFENMIMFDNDDNENLVESEIDEEDISNQFIFFDE